jgi:hypothetical protein
VIIGESRHARARERGERRVGGEPIFTRHLIPLDMN